MLGGTRTPSLRRPTAFAQGRLAKQELDLRSGQAFAARTCAELAVLTADLPAGQTRTQPARKAARASDGDPGHPAIDRRALDLSRGTCTEDV